MTIEDNDRIDLIKYRLQQAEEAVSDVELLIINNRLHSAVNRIYYGMFYSLLALGLAEGFETSKHAQLIGWFNKSFVFSGKINDRYGKIITKAFNRRTKSDYDTFVTYEKDEVSQMFDEMKEFIIQIKNLLQIS